MVNNADDNHPTDRHHASALRILENGPHAPQCPYGHGPLTTVTDHDAPTGVVMVCPQCGQRRDTEVTMLRTLLNPDHTGFDQPLKTPTENPSVTDTAEIPRVRPEDTAREPLGKITPRETTRDNLADADETDFDVPEQPTAAHRGHRPDGTIRTTGWLQLGKIPISSGLWAALTGAALGLALIDLQTWLPLTLAAAAFAAWFATTRWWLPASAATNIEQVNADELLPGDAVRIYGPIGPVGLVDQVTLANNQQVLVRYSGGTQRFLSEDTRCHLVQLRS
ncbi:hypothetical protein ACWDKQ_21760 [Saccharopolyspora sp. NPDC000995]